MAGVIKTGRLIPASGEVRAEVYNVEDWSDQGQKYVDQIRQQATKLLSDARREADQIRARAHQEGLAAGREAAEQAAIQHLQQQLETVLPALRNAATQLQETRTSWLRQWENQVLDVAVAMAGQLVRQAWQQRPEISLRWIQEALELAAGDGHLTLRLHPEDIQILQPRLDLLLAELTGLGSVQIVSDEQLERGGCVVHSEFGQIDQQLRSQLDRLREELEN